RSSADRGFGRAAPIGQRADTPVRILWAVNDRFLRALRREPVDRTPVWFMRQAGRYLPEYRELRGDRNILDAIREPEVAVELTLQPLRRMPLDAAIVFADIMVPVAAIGVPVRIAPAARPVAAVPLPRRPARGGGGAPRRRDPPGGPVAGEPIRDAAGVARLRALEPDLDEPFVAETLRLLPKDDKGPPIGVPGAPLPVR